MGELPLIGKAAGAGPDPIGHAELLNRDFTARAAMFRVNWVDFKLYR